MEERIFSHTDKFQKPKLTSTVDSNSLTTVYNVNSVIGSHSSKWVLGILTQKEDANYYLEDGDMTVRVAFQDLEWVDPDSFFTESCVVLCCGTYRDDMFKLTHIMHPPLHAKKSFKFKLNEHDYFGAYTKKKTMIIKVDNEYQ